MKSITKRSASLLTFSTFAAWSRAQDATTLAQKETIIMGALDSVKISEWSYYYTHGLHLAGTNFSQASWTRDRFVESGIATTIVPYNVLVNYPIAQSLSLTFPNGTVFNAAIQEAVLPADETTGYPNRVPTFHGYSFTGSATAEYVFAGRGHKTDFQRLVDLGVNLEGKIALVQYGPQLRGLKVKSAQEFGMVGCVIYSDPGDDGNIRIENGHLPYPDGPARNPSSVQRGSVSYFSVYVGDPTTPGYPSKPGVPRQDTSSVTPRIPSLPLSYTDARPLLEALNGHGLSPADVGSVDWSGGLPGITYSSGPAAGAVVTINNVMEDTITDIWDVIGIINGTNADEVVIMGNHRDAWIVGGAADPNSATAVLVELARAFGKLVASGWKPRRTIVFASWDAEEYGLVGSTEWLEEYITWASPNVVAYLNIDIAAAGPLFALEANPELHDLLFETMKKIPAPNTPGKTIFDNWTTAASKIGVLGAHSDFTAFVQAGITAVDLSYGPSVNDPVYHYHSNYDSYHWMTTFGDPGWAKHVAAGQFLGVLALNMIERPLIPLNVATYATSLATYTKNLQAAVQTSGLNLDLTLLNTAVTGFATIANKFMPYATALSADDKTLKAINTRLKTFGRGFLNQDGLPGRSFYKHMIYAAGSDSGYVGTTFPGITEAVSDGDLATAQEFVVKVSNAIWQATAILAVGSWKGASSDYSTLAF